MADFRWIQVSLFVIAVLQFTAPAEGLPSSFSFFTVRAGQDVTLSCENVIDDQQNCDRTTWLFSYLSRRATVQLITLGQIGKSKSDRLSVTQKCSLVIKKVTYEDVGSYFCQQWKSGHRQAPDSVVYLSVVTVTEHITDQVVWLCSVGYDGGWCRHRVKWLYDGNNVDEDHTDLQTPQFRCSASVTFKTSHFIHTSKSDLLKCEVTDENNMQQLFPFRLQPSGDDTTTEPKTRRPTTKPPTTKPRPEPKTRRPPTTPDSSMKRGTITTVSAINDDSTNLKGWWRLLIVSAGLAALIIIVLAVNVWTRTKGRKTQMDENMLAGDEDDGAANYENVTSSV